MTSKEQYIRASLAAAALELFPASIKEALISAHNFCKEYGLQTDAVLTLAPFNAEFNLSSLVNAIRRRFLSNAESISVQDNGGSTWALEIGTVEGTSEVVLSSGGKKAVIPSLMLLSPDKATRLDALSREAKAVALPSAIADKWLKLLEITPPNDEELLAIRDSLSNSPISTQRAIEGALSDGRVLLAELLPKTPEYYERLVGKILPNQSLDEFIATGAASNFNELISWNQTEGYLLSLLATPLPALNYALSQIEIPDDRLVEVYDTLLRNGDILSRTAALEAGIGRVLNSPALHKSFESLVKLVAANEPVCGISQYKVFSIFFILVYGELSRTGVLSSKPPFWRRLAAIAQAGIIARGIRVLESDAERFISWAEKTRSRYFVFQCLIDLRLEPRWIPELSFSHQIQNEFAGRIFFAATAQDEFVTKMGWRKHLLDERPGSIRSGLNIVECCLPGPLEGGIKPKLELSEDLFKQIETDLTSSKPTAKSFLRAVNCSLLFYIPPKISTLAAEALARADYYIDCKEQGDDPKSILLGLAMISAVSRDKTLADNLFILLRIYRQRHRDILDIDAVFNIGMRASASRHDFSDWCKCVGDFLTDLAFQDISDNEAAHIYACIQGLCQLAPMLWDTCGHADAALRSILNT